MVPGAEVVGWGVRAGVEVELHPTSATASTIMAKGTYIDFLMLSKRVARSR